MVVVVSSSIVSMDGGCGSPTMWGLVIVGCGWKFEGEGCDLNGMQGLLVKFTFSFYMYSYKWLFISMSVCVCGYVLEIQFPDANLLCFHCLVLFYFVMYPSILGY